jgi:hypothetical protein
MLPLDEEMSIKDATRKARAATHSRGIRHKIESGDVPLPVNWKQFIDHPENKAELANFLSEQMIIKDKATLEDCEVVTSGGFIQQNTAESSHEADVSLLEASHEEADTHIIMHGIAAKKEGYKRLIVSCRDTDVLVLLVHFTNKLPQEIWFRTGTARQRRFVAVHDINFRQTIRQNLPAYHALSGCDTVSQLSGQGKKSAWKTFQKHAPLLDDLGHGPMSAGTVEQTEELICQLYFPTTNETSINEMHYTLFLRGDKDAEKLPPRQKSLQRHIKRAHHQATIWYLAAVPQPELATPVGSGWIQDAATGELLPHIKN